MWTLGQTGTIHLIPAEMKQHICQGCTARAKVNDRQHGGNASPRFHRLLWEMFNEQDGRAGSLIEKRQKLQRAVYCVWWKLLTQNTPDADVVLPGSTTVKVDRDTERSSKRKAGDLHCLSTTHGATGNMWWWMRPAAVRTSSFWRWTCSCTTSTQSCPMPL